MTSPNAARLALTAVLAVSAVAHANTPPSKAQCLDAHEQGQALRAEGKLLEARTHLLLCAHEACPGLVNKDCGRHVSELAKLMPSFRAELRAPDGSTVKGATVIIDGQIVPEGAGQSIERDPGTHRVRLVAPDGRATETSIELMQGQRDVAVVLELPRPVAPAAPEPEPEPEPVTSSSTINPLVYVLGGVAVVGLGGFVGFGLSGSSKEADLDACKPNCASDDVDSMRSSYLLADISLGIALAAGGAAAYFYFSRPKSSTQEQVGFLRASPRPGGAQLTLGATF